MLYSCSNKFLCYREHTQCHISCVQSISGQNLHCTCPTCMYASVHIIIMLFTSHISTFVLFFFFCIHALSSSLMHSLSLSRSLSLSLPFKLHPPQRVYLRCTILVHVGSTMRWCWSYWEPVLRISSTCVTEHSLSRLY